MPTSRIVRFVERPLIIMHPTTATPDGYMECNGAAISRTVYGWLFSKIGTSYGAGDGSTTFNIPDMRGEFVRGLDSGRGVDSGRGIGTAQADQFKSHAHRYKIVPNVMQSGANSAALTDWENAGTQSGNVEPLGDGETRPRNVAQMFCIAWKP